MTSPVKLRQSWHLRHFLCSFVESHTRCLSLLQVHPPTFSTNVVVVYLMIDLMICFHTCVQAFLRSSWDDVLTWEEDEQTSNSIQTQFFLGGGCPSRSLPSRWHPWNAAGGGEAGLRGKWLLSDLDALVLYNTSGLPEQRVHRQRRCWMLRRGMGVSPVYHLVDDVYFAEGLWRVRISSSSHHLVENHRYPRAPLEVEDFFFFVALFVFDNLSAPIKHN